MVVIGGGVPVILTQTEMLLSQMVASKSSTAGKSKCKHIVDIHY